MKIILHLTQEEQGKLRSVGLQNVGKEAGVDSDVYDDNYGQWKKTLPLGDHATWRIKAIASCLWTKADASYRKDVALRPARPAKEEKPGTLAGLFELRIIITLLALILLWLLFALPAKAQFSKINYVEWQDGGTPVTDGFFTYPFTINCGANLTCTASGGTLTMTAGAGGSVAWSALTDPTAVTVFNSGAAAELFQLNFTAAYGATDVLFRIEQLTGNPLAGSVAFEVQAADVDILLARFWDGSNGVQISQPGLLTALGTGGVSWPALLNYPTGCTNQFVRSIADTLTCNTVALASDVSGLLDETNLDVNVVLDNTSNTYSTGAQDFSSATSLTVPVAAGAGPTVSGQVAYDSTANQLEYGDNAVNRVVVNLNEAQTLSTKTLDSTNVVQAGAYGAASIDGDDINSNLAGTALTLTAAAPDTLDCDVASATAVGCPELATIAETDTGTDAARVITPDGLAGSIHGELSAQMIAFDFTTAVTTGDGAFYFYIEQRFNGMNLVRVVAAVVGAVSSSGAVNVDIARCAVVATGIPCSGVVADMLSTNMTIDVNEDSSDTAAVAAVIDAANDDVATDQMVRVDVDVAGTGTQGLIVTMVFRTP